MDPKNIFTISSPGQDLEEVSSRVLFQISDCFSAAGRAKYSGPSTSTWAREVERQKESRVKKDLVMVNILEKL